MYLCFRSISFQHRKYLFGIQLNKSNWEPLPQLLGEIFDQNATTSSDEGPTPTAPHLPTQQVAPANPPPGTRPNPNGPIAPNPVHTLNESPIVSVTTTGS